MQYCGQFIRYNLQCRFNNKNAHFSKCMNVQRSYLSFRTNTTVNLRNILNILSLYIFQNHLPPWKTVSIQIYLLFRRSLVSKWIQSRLLFFYCSRLQCFRNAFLMINHNLSVSRKVISKRQSLQLFVNKARVLFLLSTLDQYTG